MNADLVLATTHALTEHGPLSLLRLAGLLGSTPAEVRAQIEAFNDVEASGLLLDPLFTITPDGGWPEDLDEPDPEPADTDVVDFTSHAAGRDLGLAHQDAATLGPLLAAGDLLRTLEPDNLALASAVETLAATLLTGVTGHAAYRARVAAAFQHAAHARRAMRITYSSVWTQKVSTRTIHPYRVVSTRRGYEVDAGPLDDRGRPRTFLLNGIRDYGLLEDAFTVPPAAAGAIEANRELTPVTGVAPHRCMWAVRHWAERVDQGPADTDDIQFTAWLLPPVPQRAALICLAAGPGVDLDDPVLALATAQAATDLLAHHGL